ncbi:MAG: aminotransferase class IV [Planctomycetaceae bacterium]
MTEPVVYLSGRTVPASQAHLAIYDGGIVLGATVTEMTRDVSQRKLFRPSDHIDRLYRSLKYVRFDIGLSKAEMTQISEDVVVARNAKLLGGSRRAGADSLRHAGRIQDVRRLGRGRGPIEADGVRAHVSAAVRAVGEADAAGGAGLHAVDPPRAAAVLRPEDQVSQPDTHYLADQSARAGDPEAIALLLDLDGNVTETSANFLIVERGTIVSPTLRNTLPG